MAQKLSLKDLELKNKKVLMRVDFNVPLNKGVITDDTRLRASLPSIQYILDHGASLILMSHLGRPKGKRMPEFSLAPCAKRLTELLKKPVGMASDCVGLEVEEMANNLKPNQIFLLENLRFHSGEEQPQENPSFAAQLSKLGDLYINDAFGTAHRSHASTAVIAQYFPGKAAAGFLMEKEIRFLNSVLSSPAHPFYAIVGGAKVSTKFGVLKALISKVDGLLLGGGMAFNFFKAQGLEIGNSIHEDEYLMETQEIIAECKVKGVKLLLPVDNVIVESLGNEVSMQVVDSSKGFPKGFEGVDIGPKTVDLFSQFLQDAAMVFWNGPVGAFEYSNFAKGTTAIAKTLASLSATTIVGGGDSIAALQSLGMADKITYLSTGGGASLEFLQYGTLPGIESLSNAH